MKASAGASWPARVDIRRRNDACYRSRSDEVLLPRREQFDEPVGFYQTALHELAHATEHESRLDRHLDENRFGSARYIREELVTEVPAFLASTNADLGHSPGVLPAGDRPRARLEDGPKSCLTYIYSGTWRPASHAQAQCTAIIVLTAIPAIPQAVGTAVHSETHFASAGLRVPRPHGDARVRRPVRHPNGRGTESGSPGNGVPGGAGSSRRGQPRKRSGSPPRDAARRWPEAAASRPGDAVWTERGERASAKAGT